MTKPELVIIAAEASKLLYENPSWPYKKVINKVKEMLEEKE